MEVGGAGGRRRKRGPCAPLAPSPPRLRVGAPGRSQPARTAHCSRGPVPTYRFLRARLRPTPTRTRGLARRPGAWSRSDPGAAVRLCQAAVSPVSPSPSVEEGGLSAQLLSNSLHDTSHLETSRRTPTAVPTAPSEVAVPLSWLSCSPEAVGARVLSRRDLWGRFVRERR